MDEIAQDPAPISPVKRALIEIRELKARLAAAEVARSEPIAIVGMGLRFPGADDPPSFAELLWSQGDAISDVPGDRWAVQELYSSDPDAPGKICTRRGGFLGRVDQFDADFFGISPREAASMDPQQRILMEASWEALENAGHAADRLAGIRGGVYLGISNSDYGRALFAQPEQLDIYASTGGAHSIAAGRLSYFLGWHGPSIAIDTACSSSLVALHLACQGLRLRECDLALAGGVNLILTPELSICFSSARMMSPDGRCKTFDDAANGYVRGEGCGVVVLRRLSDALADGDRILALVRGSAVNQDGRSGGLTAPSGPAQQAVIRAALQTAGVAPHEIGYLEAHGTGTPLGDPIEIGAIGSVFSAGRDRSRPLAVGSVKTNIGHLEAAAGIAGVVKVVLALQRGTIPPNLHFQTGNPLIDWAGLPITVPVKTMPWPLEDGRRLAGVSSFGFSGCNAHVILEQAPEFPQPEATDGERPLHVIALSAREPQTLRELARRYEAALTDDMDIADVCHTANAGRSHFNARLAVAGATVGEMRQELAAFGEGRSNGTVSIGLRDGAARPQVAFLFTGQGAQYPRMGLELYATSPTFRQALDECASGLAPFMERGLLEILREVRDATAINQTLYAQPVTFAIEYALAMLWRSWGIEPVAVLGHSVGEYAAACIAGILCLDDALRLVAERGRLTTLLAQEGMMAAVFANHDVVANEVARAGGALEIAAYNGPEHFVVTGERDAVSTVLARMQQAGVRCRQLQMSYAAHSRLLDPVVPAFRNVLQGVSFQQDRVALVSNVTGNLASSADVGNVEYWLEHMRRPVRFGDGMNALAAQGITHCVEIGPHPVLLAMAAECVPGNSMTWLPSLRRDRPEWSDLTESLRRLYVDGADVDWNGFDRGYRRRRTALPTYPFHRRRHWIDIAGAGHGAPVTARTRWSKVSAAVGRQAEHGPLDLDVRSYPARWDCLARLTLAHAAQTLCDAGLFVRAGEARTLEAVLSRAGIGVTYQHLIRRWLDGLVASGWLRMDGDIYVADAPLPDPALPALWLETGRLLDDDQPLLTYLRNCGGLVGDVLRGKASPLETLFPGGSFDLAEDLYQRSGAMRYINGLAAAAVAALGHVARTGSMLRVLEIGAGTGGTTASLLPVLAEDQTRYLFTDVSDLFIDRARQRFGKYPFVSYARFDLEQDPSDQGFSPASFDIILSANAVHAAVDLPATLGRLRDLLAPGGLLILIESTTHFTWFDMTTGLIEGWQHFADDLRKDAPLLAATQWTEALQEVGFEKAAAWPEAGSLAASLGQHLLIAQVAGEISTDGPRLERSKWGVERASAPRAAEFAPLQGAWDERQARLLEALPSERHDRLCDFVREHVMEVLRRDADELPDRHDRLMDLGLDSLMAVQLRDQLGRHLSLKARLPATLMFDHPTIDSLASFLRARLWPPEAPVDPISVRSQPDTEGAHGSAPAGLAAVAAMSDADIEARLLERFRTRHPVEEKNGN
jgi:acyl transferase domain-containing protein/SAM-dependent methyltransferase